MVFLSYTPKVLSSLFLPDFLGLPKNTKYINNF
jgi:hypothetical protein